MVIIGLFIVIYLTVPTAVGYFLVSLFADPGRRWGAYLIMLVLLTIAGFAAYNLSQRIHIDW